MKYNKIIKYSLIIVLSLFSYINVSAKEGWVNESGNTYYYENDKPVSGLKTISGKKYFFGITTNKLLHGWQNYNGRFYADDVTGELKEGWQQIDNEKYYFKDGFALSGFNEIDENTYFFGITTNKLLHGWQNYNGKFYLDEEGKIINGWNTINGERYYTENNYVVSGEKTIDNKKYFFGITTNKLLYGWQNYNGKFYADDVTGELKEGWQQIDNEIYYFKDSRALSGLNEIDSKKYFFGITTNKLLHGWQNYNGRFYADDVSGELKEGWQQIDNEKYYFKDGFALSGFNEIDENTYFFGITTNKLLHGWQNYNGKFYLDEEGKIINGWNTINGDRYYIENNYVVSGEKIIDGNKYFFGITSNKLLHGWQSMNNNYWYQDENGAFLKGNQTIDGRNYFFDESTGYLSGFKSINDKLYYYNPDGTQVKGVQYMANKFWKFNELTGEFEKFVRQIRVIDISSHNGNIDWETVKKSNLVDAVILRLGYGVGYIDSSFIRNKNELERLGIPYSIYLFSYAENANEALMESNFLINTIRSYNIHIASNVLGIYYDLEDWKINSTGENSYGITKDTYGQIITTFIDNTEKNLCIKTRVYASKNYIETRFPDYAKNYATWIAQWGDNITYQGPYEGWQYTSDGSIPGINGRVDMSIFYY